MLFKKPEDTFVEDPKLDSLRKTMSELFDYQQKLVKSVKNIDPDLYEAMSVCLNNLRTAIQLSIDLAYYNKEQSVLQQARRSNSDFER